MLRKVSATAQCLCVVCFYNLLLYPLKSCEKARAVYVWEIYLKFASAEMLNCVQVDGIGLYWLQLQEQYMLWPSQ